MAVQHLKVDGVSDDYLIFTHRRNLAADDVDIPPELSFDGVHWFSGEAYLIFLSEVHQGDGTSLITYRTAFPYDPATAQGVSFRVQATLR